MSLPLLWAHDPRKTIGKVVRVPDGWVVILMCNEHPRYRAKMRPRSTCGACKLMFLLAEEARREGSRAS